MYIRSYSYSNGTFTEMAENAETYNILPSTARYSIAYPSPSGFKTTQRSEITSAFKNADSSPMSDAVCRIQAFSGGASTTYSPEQFVSVEIDRSGCNGAWTVGSVSSATVDIEMLTSVADTFVNCDYFYVYLGYKGLSGTSEQYLRFGRFFIDKSQTERKHLFTKLKGYDALYQPLFSETLYLYAVPLDDMTYSHVPYGEYLFYRTAYSGNLPSTGSGTSKVYTGSRFSTWVSNSIKETSVSIANFIKTNYPELGIDQIAYISKSYSSRLRPQGGTVPANDYAGKYCSEGVSEPVRNTTKDLVSRAAIMYGGNIAIENDMLCYYSTMGSAVTGMEIPRSCIKSGGITLGPVENRIKGVRITQESMSQHGSSTPTVYEYSTDANAGSFIELSLDDKVYDDRLEPGRTQSYFDTRWSNYVTSFMLSHGALSYRAFTLEAFNNILYEPFDLVKFTDDDNVSRTMLILDAKYKFNGSLMVEYSAEVHEDDSAIVSNDGSGTAELGGSSSAWSLYGTTTGTSSITLDLSKFSEVKFFIESQPLDPEAEPDEQVAVLMSTSYNVSDLETTWVNVGGWYTSNGYGGKGEILITSISGRNVTLHISSVYVNTIEKTSQSTLKVYVR